MVLALCLVIGGCASLTHKSIDINGQQYDYVFAHYMGMGASIATCDRFKDKDMVAHDSSGGPGVVGAVFGNGTTQGLLQGAFQSGGIQAAPEIMTLPMAK
jgi:hypothetical protein